MSACLSAYEKWMVKSNLDRIHDEGLSHVDVAANLRARGYARVADAVERYGPELEAWPWSRPNPDHQVVNPDVEHAAWESGE